MRACAPRGHMYIAVVLMRTKLTVHAMTDVIACTGGDNVSLVVVVLWLELPYVTYRSRILGGLEPIPREFVCECSVCGILDCFHVVMHICRAAARLRAPDATLCFEDMHADDSRSGSGSDTSARACLVQQRCPRVSAVITSAMRRKSSAQVSPATAGPSLLSNPRGSLPSFHCCLRCCCFATVQLTAA